MLTAPPAATAAPISRSAPYKISLLCTLLYTYSRAFSLSLAAESKLVKNTNPHALTTTSSDVNTSGMAVWKRILLCIIAFHLITGSLQVVGLLLIKIDLSAIDPASQLSLQNNLLIQELSFAGSLLTVYLCRSKIDKESFVSLGLSLKNRLSDIISGFVVALLIIGLGCLLLYSLGSWKVVAIHPAPALLLKNLFLFGMVAISEELLVRGYLLNNLLRGMNRYAALVLSSLLFALIHLFNPDMDVLPFINLLLAGILLGATYIFTKNLWFAISLHLFWNYLQGPIAGFNVSGIGIEPLLKTEISGNHLLTGGGFGYEGSLLCSLLTLAGILSVLFYYTSGHFRKEAQPHPLKQMNT